MENCKANNIAEKFTGNRVSDHYARNISKNSYFLKTAVTWI